MSVNKQNEEDENDRQKQIVLSGSNLVNSTAVVKFSNNDVFAKYQTLQPKTNLNELPPEKINIPKFPMEINLGLRGKQPPFTSIQMAHCFPEVAGDIDVISDNENIKRLLKMPFSKGQISMMVHKVGNTILLDDFDVHKHILRKQQDDWHWIRKFFFEDVLEKMPHLKEGGVAKKNKSRKELQRQDMLSKFLQYSNGSHEKASVAQYNLGHATTNKSDLDASCQAPDPLPKLMPEDSGYNHNVIWTFEDIRMLIGTDLPIFGDGERPCVSLRLRDMHKPINVLTGLDYWLDNLMCNVPELAMCYHLNGIVQNYELLKTEEIPNLEGSKFSPELVRDIAQNILSFLQEKATKEGHTYWLFKGQGDDIVKLYDLTTLCTEYMENKSDNPFTVPVAYLLYRVARNMRQTFGRKKITTIRKLLEHALSLLDSESHSQVVTSAYYLLSDLLVTDNTDNMPYVPEPPQYEDIIGEDDNDFEPCNDNPVSSVDVHTLCVRDSRIKDRQSPNNKDRFTPNSKEVCTEAIGLVVNGLVCLDKSVTSVATNSTKERELAQCNPSEAIPLHYHPLNKPNTENERIPDSESKDNEMEKFVDIFDTQKCNQLCLLNRKLPNGSWHFLSKFLLLKKACVTYHTIAENLVSELDYGSCLRYLQVAFHCFSAMKCLIPSKGQENVHLLSLIFSLTGECFHTFSKIPLSELQKHIKRFKNFKFGDLDIQMLKSIKLEVDEIDDSIFVITEMTNHAYIEKAINLMKHSVYLVTNEPSLYQTTCRRLGNTYNETGVYYMNSAETSLKNSDESELKMAAFYIEKSKGLFVKGVDTFKEIHDKINMAMLKSNLGRLMRLLAQVESLASEQQVKELTLDEHSCYMQAIDHYQTALKFLGDGEENRSFCDSIKWDISSTHFQCAVLLQDHPPFSRSSKRQIELLIKEHMEKACTFCESIQSINVDTKNQRLATIHHRLASLFHNSLREEMNEEKRDSLQAKAEQHYEKAVNYFKQSASNPCMYLRVQLERVAMCEYQVDYKTHPFSKLRLLQQAFDYLLWCAPILRSINSSLVSSKNAQKRQTSAEAEKEVREEANKLQDLIRSRAKVVLLNLVKYSADVKKRSNKQKLYKELYMLMVQDEMKSKGSSVSLSEKCISISKLLETLSEKLNVDK